MANPIQSFIKNENPPVRGKLNRSRRVVFLIFNIGMTLLLSVLLFFALGNIADKYPAPEPENSDSTTVPAGANSSTDSLSFVQRENSIEVNDTTPSTRKDSMVDQQEGDTIIKNRIVQKTRNKNVPGNRVVLDLLYIMLLTGGLGGVMCNLRGIFQRFRDEDGTFAIDLEVPYYIRPFSGALCGMMFFFLSSFFAASLTNNGASDLGWETFAGIFPYAGIAFIAGYASQEFMERLKEIAKAVFPGQKESNPPVQDPETKKQ